MKVDNVKVAEAVNSNILMVDNPENFSKSLDNMFHVFIHNEGIADDSLIRSTTFNHYQELKEFLDQVQKRI